MAIVPYMFVPSGIFDECLKIGSDPIQVSVALLPLINPLYTTPLNNSGVRCLKYDQDTGSDIPSGVFAEATTGETYNLTAIPYTTP